ncbi:HvfC/BufC family peptide modification chaperone [Brevundimonas sp.]|uniref:HvfC/BufC family peptide modification chaperone n=1 Tax=Brevundimonas sp. TaxID=1871086 RepID=UPI003F7163FF
MRLLEVQRAFQSLVLQGDTAAIETAVFSKDQVDARRRLGVYSHAYRATMTGLLSEVFDKTWAYLGDERFEAEVATYVAAHRSTSFSLDDYGSDFPGQLEQRLPDEPDVFELAWLDWSMRRAFDGPDAEPVAAAQLAALSPDDWDRARLGLHPTLVQREVVSNVGALWASLDAGAPVLPPPLTGPMSLRVWRKGLQPHFRMIPPQEGAALQAIATGQTFAALCEDLGRDGSQDAPVRAGRLLAVWLEDGLIVDVAF